MENVAIPVYKQADWELKENNVFIMFTDNNYSHDWMIHLVLIKRIDCTSTSYKLKY